MIYKRVNLTIDSKTLKELSDYAEENAFSRSTLMRLAIKEYLQRRRQE